MRPSRRPRSLSSGRAPRGPVGGLLRMRNSINAITDLPHGEERPLRDAACGGSSGQAGASRTTDGRDAAFLHSNKSTREGGLKFPLARRFLPHEIITARMTELAHADGAAAVYCAADAQVDWLIAPSTGGCRSHRQLSLRPDRPPDPQSCGGGIPHLAVHD